jgi:hypothetical protein
LGVFWFLPIIFTYYRYTYKNTPDLGGIVWFVPIGWAVILLLLDVWLGIKLFKGAGELFVKVFRKGEQARREEARKNYKRRIQNTKDRRKQIH